MPTISIVVPIYNVEKYVRKCIESLIHQTYTNLEILLINDGSTDQSGKIADEYALKDKRIKVIHQQNAGLSAARNTGVDHARGEYISFIDSDDYVDLDMYEMMLRNGQKENADISICGIYHVYANDIKTNQNTTGYYVLDQQKAVQWVLKAEMISVNAVNKLYRRELFNELRYPLGKLSEDAHIILKVLEKVSVVVVDMHPKYYYVHRDNSITTSVYKKADLSVIEAYENNLDIVKNKYPMFINEARTRVVWSYFYVLDKMMITKPFQDKEDLKKVVKYIRKNYQFIIQNKIFTKNRKIAITMLCINIYLYKIFVVMQRNKKNKVIQ